MMLSSVTSFALLSAGFASSVALAENQQQRSSNTVVGCNNAWQGPSYTTFTIYIDNYPREYSVYVPANYSLNHPRKPIAKRSLIFDFHGADGSSAGQYNNSMYWAHPQGQNYLVVYPQGSYKDWYGAPYAHPPSVHDALFVDELIKHMTVNYCVDPTRIYASGKSNGGGFVDVLACDEVVGDKFAAFAMAAPALYSDSSLSACPALQKSRKILEAHGEEDPVMSYTGCSNCTIKHGTTNYTGIYLPNIGDWVWWWAQREKHSPKQNFTDDSSLGYGYVTYNTSGNPGVVSHYRIPNLGHCWPQSQRTANNTDYRTHKGCNSYKLDFTDKVISFFEASSLSAKADGEDEETNARKEL